MDTEIQRNNTDTLSSDEEIHIQRKLELLTGGKHARCPAGIIDILSDTELIEIKRWHRWKEALGQIMAYRIYYPNHSVRIHFFDKKPHNFDSIIDTLQLYDINVTSEKCETSKKSSKQTNCSSNDIDFLDIFRKFIDQTCITADYVKCRSSKLMESFRTWVEGNSIVYEINGTEFNYNMNKYFPEFEYKRMKYGMIYTGICPKQYYIHKDEPDYDEMKQKKREYHREYYERNKHKVRKQQKSYYNIKCVYDQELIDRTGLAVDKFIKYKKLGLIRYIFNRDQLVDWTETITRMQSNIKTYEKEKSRKKIDKERQQCNENIPSNDTSIQVSRVRLKII